MKLIGKFGKFFTFLPICAHLYPFLPMLILAVTPKIFKTVRMGLGINGAALLACVRTLSCSGGSFPNITELYRHKYKSHQQSLVLHNHLGPKRAREWDESEEVVSYKPDMYIVQYDPSTPLLGVCSKRKRESSAVLEDNHEAIRNMDEVTGIDHIRVRRINQQVNSIKN